MATRNLLLGRGETLTSYIPTPRKKPEKTHPYSFDELRGYLIERLEFLIESGVDVPDIARPYDSLVAKITLHPAYLAKSFYPENLFAKYDLEDLGSKAVHIKPRKQTTNVLKESMVANCIFVVGSSSSFETLRKNIEEDNVVSSIQNDLRKIESLDYFSPNEKLKTIRSGKDKRKLELTLHTPDSKRDLLEKFNQFAQECGVELDLDRKIETGGLTFLPALGNEDTASKLAAFTYLRVLRDLPELRVNEPVVTRSVVSSEQLPVPDAPAMDSELNVAVFDGGIGVNTLEKWCTEKVYPGGHITSPDLLNHGAEVTSTVLFGNLTPHTKSLPVPYTNIDHFRVLDAVSGKTPDLFDVLRRITDALESKHYDYVNLSLGPRLPIQDDEVNAWTSTLEPFLASGKTLMTVAVGNDGKLDGLNRIQPPSDLINGLSVGSANSSEAEWSRASYSCVGPGRSPGLVKPDGVVFGGDVGNLFLVFSPITKFISGTGGTSFAAPLALRTAIGINARLEYPITPLIAKALLIHHADRASHPASEVGWGRFPTDLDEIVYCNDDEVTVIYSDELAPSQYLKADIPFPNIELKGMVTIRATFCFATDVDAAHPVNYSRNGLSITFRPKGPDSSSQPFFSKAKLYETEWQARNDAHKWESTLQREQRFRSGSLENPCFEVVYQARERGRGARVAELKPLPYVLIVTVQVNNTPEVYNAIRQQYSVLEPIQLRDQVRVQSRG